MLTFELLLLNLIFFVSLPQPIKTDTQTTTHQASPRVCLKVFSDGHGVIGSTTDERVLCVIFDLFFIVVVALNIKCKWGVALYRFIVSDIYMVG